MRKIISALFAFVMLFSFANTPALAIDSEKNTVDVADVIIKFYKNKDINANYDISSYVSTDVLGLLNDKIDTAKYVDELYNFERQDYTINIRLVKSKASGSVVQMDFAVETICKYSANQNSPSTIGEYVIILYDTSIDKIIDFYTPGNYYDETIRPEENEIKVLNVNGYKADRNIRTKCTSLINDINDVYNKQGEKPSPDKNIAAIMQTRAAVGINLGAVVNYARSNFNKFTPASGSPSIEYVDFSDVGINNYDCTNFVSHALLKGGANMNDTGGNGITDYNGWYFRDINNRGKAWSAVGKFHTYMTTNRIYGTAAGRSFEYTTYEGEWSTGYVLQTTPVGETNYSHSMIITRKDVDRDRAYAYVTGRTDDFRYNDNAPVEQMNPNRLKRVIYVYNIG